MFATSKYTVDTNYRSKGRREEEHHSESKEREGEEVEESHQYL